MRRILPAKAALALVAPLILCSMDLHAQACAGGEIATRQAYEHGRFETRMRSVRGDGVVSSFFLYNLDLGCNWPDENNEIDVEMTGNRDASVQFTTHYPGPWSVTQIVPTPFDPHADLHDYAIEWEPGIVRWFVDGGLVYTQDASYVSGLIYPMRILMNLYAADVPSWVGDWDPSVMPAQSSYDYVRYYAYTPGAGNAGTGDNFTLAWTDEFDSLDTDRWQATEFGGFGGNYCSFVSANVGASGGQLSLSITEPLASTSTPIQFSVDATSLNLAPTDVIYLNGTFNGWCGTCNPMTDDDGDDTWELTLTLPAGKHEYLYTKNFWEQLGGAPLGSSCDFAPCDIYGNYGLAVPYDSGAIDTGTFCWGTCEDCSVADTDQDGVPDDADNCTGVANAAQRDTDGDGIGNYCDADLNGDCSVSFGDLAAMKAAFFPNPYVPDADFDGDGFVNFADLALMKSTFFNGPNAGPGPSSVPNDCDQAGEP